MTERAQCAQDRARWEEHVAAQTCDCGGRFVSHDYYDTAARCTWCGRKFWIMDWPAPPPRRSGPDNPWWWAGWGGATLALLLFMAVVCINAAAEAQGKSPPLWF
jgi:hypothetical protein